MFGDLYSTQVLALAADIPHTAPIPTPDGRAHKVSRLCGSEVTVALSLDDGVVSAFEITPKACALGQAAASILSRHVIGCTPAELFAARNALVAMLKQNGPPPEGRFRDLRLLAGVADFPARHASTLLAFEAAAEAVEQALMKKAEQSPS